MLCSAQRGRVTPEAMHAALLQQAQPQDVARRVLTEQELATRWGVSHKTLARWRVEGKGPKYLKLSGSVRYALTDIEDYERAAGHYSTSIRAHRGASS